MPVTVTWKCQGPPRRLGQVPLIHSSIPHKYSNNLSVSLCSWCRPCPSSLRCGGAAIFTIWLWNFRPPNLAWVRWLPNWQEGRKAVLLHA
jgi:hypothetical protein